MSPALPCTFTVLYFVIFMTYAPSVGLAARRLLRSAARGDLLVPRVHLATVQRSAFSVVDLWTHQHGMISPLSCVPC